ncbi:MAG: two pore domain potassium channel family protein, partial [Phycisphaerae bacterium]|nr:two pore domain potassium channel family protein [Phycisphaerae bacterium]
MNVIFFFAGLLLVLIVLIDAFETVLLPRRISHRLRYSRFYYRSAWWIWRRTANGLVTKRWRESVLSIFGPLSLLGLFCSWVLILIVGFAAVQWSLPSSIVHANQQTSASFLGVLYF